MKLAVRIIVALLLVLAVVVGASPRVQAAFESKAAFLPHPDCPRLHLDLTVRTPTDACAALAAATTRIADALGFSFDPPEVYLVGDQARFGRFIGVPDAQATGAVFLGDIYLSPRAFHEADWEAILAHELVHHAWRDRLGPWSTVRRQPSWFQEGLAVHLSGGGGAERATREEALTALAAGRELTPVTAGSLFRPRRPHEDGLSYPMFYRQAGLFVGFLAADQEAFAGAMGRLRGGAAVGEAIPQSYGRSIPELWVRFRAGALAAPGKRGNTREDSPANDHRIN